MKELNDISGQIVDASVHVHQRLAPGLLLKSIEALVPVHSKQLLTSMKLLDYRLGLLINFGAPLLKDGIKRVANNL